MNQKIKQKNRILQTKLELYGYSYKLIKNKLMYLTFKYNKLRI